MEVGFSKVDKYFPLLDLLLIIAPYESDVSQNIRQSENYLYTFTVTNSRQSKSRNIDKAEGVRMGIHTAQKMKFSIKDFFIHCGRIRSKRCIRSSFMKKSFMENFVFCAVSVNYGSSVIIGKVNSRQNKMLSDYREAIVLMSSTEKLF